MACVFSFPWGSAEPHERRAGKLMATVRKLPALGIVDSVYLAGQKMAMFRQPPFAYLQHLNHFGLSIARMGYVDEIRGLDDRFR